MTADAIYVWTGGQKCREKWGGGWRGSEKYALSYDHVYVWTGPYSTVPLNLVSVFFQSLLHIVREQLACIRKTQTTRNQTRRNLSIYSIKHELRFKLTMNSLQNILKFVLLDGASFYYCAYVLGFLKDGTHKCKKGIFARLMTIGMWEGQVISKGCWNPKRKLKATTHFSEIIELKFRRKSLKNAQRHRP